MVEVVDEWLVVVEVVGEQLAVVEIVGEGVNASVVVVIVSSKLDSVSESKRVLAYSFHSDRLVVSWWGLGLGIHVLSGGGQACAFQSEGPVLIGLAALALCSIIFVIGLCLSTCIRNAGLPALVFPW